MTYTPRIVRAGKDIGADRLLTMDDPNVFGEELARVDHRDLVNNGVLPDYRVWLARHRGDDDGQIVYAENAAEITLDAEDCTVRAWNASEFDVVARRERFVLNHLLVFAQTNDHGAHIEDVLKQRLNDNNTTILRIDSTVKRSLKDVLEEFTIAPRSILMSCKMLGEGVDIPVADSVAIMCNKHSRGDTTQTVLRPGRWQADKPIFHILVPLADNSLTDYESLGEVLLALATSDSVIHDEIIAREPHFRANYSTTDRAPHIYYDREGQPEGNHIIIDTFDGADVEEIRKCFEVIRNRLRDVGLKDSLQILREKFERDRQLIAATRRDSQVQSYDEYITFRTEHAEMDLPEDPPMYYVALFAKNFPWGIYLARDHTWTSETLKNKLADIMKTDKEIIEQVRKYDIATYAFYVYEIISKKYPELPKDPQITFPDIPYLELFDY